MRTGASLLSMTLMLVLAVACGGSKTAANRGATALKELHDPKVAATATLPASAPTPLSASNLVGGAVGGTPAPDTYVVKAGDTLGAIALSLGVSVDALSRANGITDPTLIRVGQQLRVPRAGTPTPSPGSTPSSASAGSPPLATAGPAPTLSPGQQVPPTGGAPSGVGTAVTGTPAPTVPPSGVPTSVRAPTSASAPVPSATSAGSASTQYTVKAGDNACAIAIARNISLQELASANGLTKDQTTRLQVGQLLKIPPPTGSRGC